MVETSSASNVFIGSGNVFVDLGFPDARERTIKIRLLVGINTILEERHLDKKDAAKLLGVTQRRLTAMQQYKSDNFTLDNLIELADALNYDVLIKLSPRTATTQLDGPSASELHREALRKAS